jgi:hypothetical protein
MLLGFSRGVGEDGRGGEEWVSSCVRRRSPHGYFGNFTV